MKKPRPKKCKTCKQKFQPEKQLQEACSIKCALELAQIKEQKKKQAQERIKRAEARERKAKDIKRREELRPLRYWIAKTQTVFNEYIKLRDIADCCISCDRQPDGYTWKGGGKFDCGHYRSVGSAAHLRFDERNANKQCVQCNRDLSGNTVEYRAGLVRKIGIDEVERLESEYYVKKWTREELAEIRAKYKDKIKELKAYNDFMDTIAEI